MLSIKENFLETLKRDGRPDRLVNQYEFGDFLPGDPISCLLRDHFYEGMEPKKDAFGVTFLYPKGAPGVMPHVTDETKVISDITEWREQVIFPDVAGKCGNDEIWADYAARVREVEQSGLFSMPFMHTGVFERTHMLLGFEDALVDFLTEPEDMLELCNAIGDYRLEVFKTLVEHAHPTLVLSHDDWGSKNNVFLRPDMWREFIKPQYEKIYGYLHEQGVIIVHHADSFLEPLIEDMVDLHIDVWQGVLPQNNIAEISKKLDGRMTLMGGMESSIVDRVDSTEREIRAEARRACEEYGSLGHFIPCITNGGPGTIYPGHYEIISDEIARFNKEVYGVG